MAAFSKRLKALMVFSFVYGGFLFLLFLLQVYSIFWRREFLPFVSSRRFEGNPEGARQPFDPVSMLLSPISILHLITATAFLINGFWLWRFLSEKSRAEAKDEVYSFVLTDDEKLALGKLRESGGRLTQKDLSVKTGFSPVKAHRVVGRLKSKGAIETQAFGMTNMVVLK